MSYEQVNGLASGIINAPLTTPQFPEIVLLNLRISRPGIKRKVSSAEIQVDAEKDAIQVHKFLIESEAYEAVEQFDRGVRTWTTRKCLPAHKCLKEGVYRVPVSLLDEIESDLDRFSRIRANRVEEVIVEYESAIEAARSKLRALFNPADYLTPEHFRDAFKFNWQYFAVSVPDGLVGVLRAKETRKFEEFQKASLEECRDALRTTFAELINRMVTCLGCDDNGKPRQIKASTLEKLDDFLSYFRARDLADDTTVAQFVEQAKTILRGASIDGLRTDADLRTTCRVAFGIIQDGLIENGITTAPTRLIEL